MSWLLIALIAYILLAFVNVADKFVLKQVIPRAKTYTFLVGLFGMLLFLFGPWVLVWPGLGLFFINLLVGSFFAAGLLFLYTALRDSEASKIFTLVGGIVPILVLFFSFLLFKEVFTFNQFLAILFLVLGTILISATSGEHSPWFKVKEWLHVASPKQRFSITMALVSALFFALYWVGTKYVYNTQPFFSGMLWIRLGTFVAVLFLLIKQQDRQEIKEDLQASGKKKNNIFIVLSTQGLGALGGILQNYAVALGSVALVTSLQGVQYAFILIITYILTILRPKIIKEDRSRKIIIRKVVAISLIGLGLYFLAYV